MHALKTACPISRRMILPAALSVAVVAFGCATISAADPAQPRLPVEVPVLNVKYFPVKGDRIDLSVTGDWGAPLEATRRKTEQLTREVVQALQEGSKYHGYKNPRATPSLAYKVVDTLEFLEPLPTVARPGRRVPITDYQSIMKRIDIRKWVVYWMQNLPGDANGLTYQGKPLTNWWIFVGDLDDAMDNNMRLVDNDPPAQRPLFQGFRPQGPRPQGPRRPAQPPRRLPAEQPVALNYGSGAKHLEVDCANAVGEIRSLLGTNRGPFSFPRRPGEQRISHVESYRTLGIDFIRTHDFYGPTDWYVIFPDWSADPDDPAGYDFESSDARIRAIVDNGFQCFYRLGTSWKGQRTRPINDPPGTIRDADGRIVHRADRDDARKWAKICVGTMRHYTEGFAGGYRFPIQYWEIWNEPDLAAQFWTGTPEQYFVFYEEAAKALKAANPKLKVGGPACTGSLRPEYIEGFIAYCDDHDVPLDFFSWHSYGGRGEFNPYQYYRDAMRVRGALDEHGFEQAENINTEWNAGIQHRLFSDTPAGAAFYASTLACMLDAGVDHAFQYCGDRHPGLGLHGMGDGKPKISAYAFEAWKRLLDAPNRVAATGSDQQGYNIVAGKDTDGRHVRILISDFQSGHDAFHLSITNLPWDAQTPCTVKLSLLDEKHRLEVVDQRRAQGQRIKIENPFQHASVCLIEIDRSVEEKEVP